MSTMHSVGYHPPPVGPAPVRVEISIDDDADREPRIPQWSYSVEVTIADGRNWIWGGTVEAMDRDQAVLRVYARAVDRISELLASFVPQVKP